MNTIIIKSRAFKSTPHQQRGLSLIELMIAMLIGLFMLLSISSVYLSNVKTNKIRDQFSLLEDNARIALDSMRNVIEHTGYKGRQNTIIENPFIIASTVINNDAACTPGRTIVNNAPVTLDGGAGNDIDVNIDSIGVKYLGTGGVTTDCSGDLPMDAFCQLSDPVNPATKKSSHIYNVFHLDSATDRLLCAGSLDRSGGEQLIAEGVENMQIVYGVDTSGDNIANEYINASSLNGKWSQVVSIQIAVLVRSEKPVKDTAEQRTYDLLGTPILSPNDKLQRAVFSTTVYIRNNS